MDNGRITENFENDSMHKMWGTETEMSKVDVYKWKAIGARGELKWIPKSELKIDLSYQREIDSKNRVSKIAREFDWALFGVILVASTQNGYYVIDGGHRIRGANRRDDINDVPCLVFKLDDPSEEARIFYLFNNERKTVSTFDNHKAALRGEGKFEESELAKKAEQLVKKYGYEFVRGIGSEFQLCSIKAVYRMIESNEQLADKTFSILAKVAQGAEIQNTEISGLFYLMQHNPAIDFFTFPMKNLIDAGIGQIRESIKRHHLIEGKGGPKQSAKALVEIINRGQSKNKVMIPF